MKERWRPVVGHEGLYEVSDHGRVRSVDRVVQRRARGKVFDIRLKGKLLRPGVASHGYPTVVIGRGNTRTVHSLVAEAFIGPPPEGQEVRHRNGDRGDPSFSNLCYGTRLDNIRDAISHGTWMSEARTKHVKEMVGRYRWGKQYAQ